MRLTREAARTGPALIAWPETAVRQLGADRLLQARLSALVDELGSALVVGASDVEKFARPGGQQLGRRAHNAAYLVEPGRPLAEPYRKMRLVPVRRVRSVRGPRALAGLARTGIHRRGRR